MQETSKSMKLQSKCSGLFALIIYLDPVKKKLLSVKINDYILSHPCKH